MISLLTVYLIFLIAFLIFSFAGVYHLLRYKQANDLSKPAVLIYCIVSAFVIIFTLISLLTRIFD